jgi:hypothetical protein
MARELGSTESMQSRREEIHRLIERVWQLAGRHWTYVQQDTDAKSGVIETILGS